MRTYTVDEVAAICKASNDTIYQAIESLELKASRIGKPYIIKEVDLDKFIDAKSLANLKAKQCQSTSEAKHGIVTSKSQGNQDLDALLRPQTSAKPKKGMMQLSLVSNK